MTERLVGVSMRMRLARRRSGVVRVLVVRVVLVAVLVLHRLVNMLVLVPLADVEPDADHHEACCDHQPGRHGLTEHDDADHGTNERRG